MHSLNHPIGFECPSRCVAQQLLTSIYHTVQECSRTSVLCVPTPLLRYGSLLRAAAAAAADGLWVLREVLEAPPVPPSWNSHRKALALWLDLLLMDPFLVVDSMSLGECMLRLFSPQNKNECWLGMCQRLLRHNVQSSGHLICRQGLCKLWAARLK